MVGFGLTKTFGVFGGPGFQTILNRKRKRCGEIAADGKKQRKKSGKPAIPRFHSAGLHHCSCIDTRALNRQSTREIDAL